MIGVMHLGLTVAADAARLGFEMVSSAVLAGIGSAYVALLGFAGQRMGFAPFSHVRRVAFRAVALLPAVVLAITFCADRDGARSLRLRMTLAAVALSGSVVLLMAAGAVHADAPTS